MFCINSAFVYTRDSAVRTPLIVSATAAWSAAHLHRNRSLWEWRRFCFNGDPIHQYFEPSHALRFPRCLKIRIPLDTIFLDVPRPKPRHVTCMVVRSPWLNCIQSSPLCSVCGGGSLPVWRLPRYPLATSIVNNTAAAVTADADAGCWQPTRSLAHSVWPSHLVRRVGRRFSN